MAQDRLGRINFLRLSRMILDDVRGKLCDIFYTKVERNWKDNKENGGWILKNTDNVPDNFNTDPVKTGETKKWDVTILAHILLECVCVTKLRDKQKKAVKMLRKFRNDHFHSAKASIKFLELKNIATKIKMCYGNLGIPSEKHGSIDDILKETYDDEAQTRLFERIILYLKETNCNRDLICSLEGCLEELKQRVIKLDGRVEQLDGRVEQLDGRVEQLDGRVERHEADSTQLGQRVTRLEENQLAQAAVGHDHTPNEASSSEISSSEEETVPTSLTTPGSETSNSTLDMTRRKKVKKNRAQRRMERDERLRNEGGQGMDAVSTSPTTPALNSLGSVMEETADDNKCPLLHMNVAGMSEAEQDELTIHLKKESMKIRCSYGILVSMFTIYLRGIIFGPKDLAICFDSISSKEFADKIALSANIGDAIRIVNTERCWDFFNYSILENLIQGVCEGGKGQKILKKLKDYICEFTTFCQQRISEGHPLVVYDRSIKLSCGGASLKGSCNSPLHVKIASMSEAENDELTIRQERECMKICCSYGVLVYKFTSYLRRIKFGPQDLAICFDFISPEVANKIASSVDIEDAIRIVNTEGCWNFLNYSILEYLIHRVCEGGKGQKILKELKVYICKFTDYSERKISEVPPEAISDKSPVGSKTFKVKMDGNFSVPLSCIKATQHRIEEILGRKPILLVSVKEGCIELVFRYFGAQISVDEKERNLLSMIGVKVISDGPFTDDISVTENILPPPSALLPLLALIAAVTEGTTPDNTTAITEDTGISENTIPVTEATTDTDDTKITEDTRININAENTVPVTETTMDTEDTKITEDTRININAENTVPVTETTTDTEDTKITEDTRININAENTVPVTETTMDTEDTKITEDSRININAVNTVPVTETTMDTEDTKITEDTRININAENTVPVTETTMDTDDTKITEDTKSRIDAWNTVSVTEATIVTGDTDVTTITEDTTISINAEKTEATLDTDDVSVLQDPFHLFNSPCQELYNNLEHTSEEGSHSFFVFHIPVSSLSVYDHESSSLVGLPTTTFPRENLPCAISVYSS